MSFKKPFAAVPIQRGIHYRRKEAVHHATRAAGIVGGAALVGAVIGVGSLAITPDRASAAAQAIKPWAVSMGLQRARAPQPGDYWSGCRSAKAAGTAPIYVGEPGYRAEMDGDGDGIACEPYYGGR
jgi:hypothetical protein